MKMPILSSPSRHLLGLAPLLALLACGPAQAPLAPKFDAGAAYTNAFQVEARGDDDGAAEAYLSLIEKAALADLGDRRIPLIGAALDALLFETPDAIADATPHAALLYRAPKFAATFDPKGDGGPAVARLRATWEKAGFDPFTRPTLAHALFVLASARGDAVDAALWRNRAGFVRDTLVTPPHQGGVPSGIFAPTPWDAAGSAAPATVSDPLGISSPPVAVATRNTAIPLHAASAAPGVRDAIVDVEAPSDGTLAIILRVDGPARLLAQGKAVLARNYLESDGLTTQRVTLEGVSGTVRLALRIGGTGTATLAIVNGSGEPLPAAAPKPGDTAKGTFKTVAVAAPAAAHSANEEALLAAGELAAGYRSAAESRLSALAFGHDDDPTLLLLRARALAGAPDLNNIQKAERIRALHEKALVAWPYAWEAVLGHAKLEGARRAPAEARFFALNDLAKHEKDLTPKAHAVVVAFKAGLFGRDPLPDEAAKLVAEAHATFPNTAMEVDVASLLVPRDAAANLAFRCSQAPGHMQDTRSCREASLYRGDLAAASKELDRLAKLYGDDAVVRGDRLRDAMRDGDTARRDAEAAKLAPGDRTLAFLPGLDAAATPGAGRDAFLQNARKANDSPMNLAAALRVASGSTPLPFDGVAEKLVAKDLAAKAFPGAGTVVLRHDESYEISQSGVLHLTTFDLRRVDGTTDVEENAEAPPAFALGRERFKVLRRRIHKQDGRILEPEKTPQAAQNHADLSQLEPGDYVEALYESWALPDANGTLGFEGADLLPERTRVVAGEIRVDLPESIKGVFLAHPLLGKPVETKKDGRLLRVYTVQNTPIRRQEEGVPRMDQDVAVTFSTATWDAAARGLRDKLVALDDADPEVATWARQAATRDGKVLPASRELVDAVVTAVGKALRQPNAAYLSDADDGPDGSRPASARSFLASREGSRTWLVHRALRELGIRSELLVAEPTPWSARADVPVRSGRFTHPLLLVAVPKTPGGAETEPVLVDADVQGPPLPPGRISPELKGRLALFVKDGTIASVPVTASDNDGDEIDIRLAVDAKGDAKGEVTVVLRGRAAQGLADAFVRVVGDERQKTLRGVVLGWLPFATVEDVSLSSSEGSWQVALRANVTIGGFAQVEEKNGVSTLLVPGIDPVHGVYPRPYSGTLRAAYTSQGKRESDFAIRAGSLYHLHRKLDFPDGSKVETLPGPLAEDATLLHGKRTLKVDGPRIEEDFSLVLESGTVPAAKFAAFGASIVRVDDGFLAGARVTTPKVPAKK